MNKSINQIKINSDKTVDIFNNFYKIQMTIDTAEYEQVFTYFMHLYDGNKPAAETFSVNLFHISQLTGRESLDLLADIKGKDSVTVTKLMCYYLNDIRSKSTLIGISDPVKPNYYAARNVLV